MNKKRTIAQKFGKLLAHVQSAFDDLSAWGFSHLKKVGQPKEQEIIDDSLSGQVKRGAKKTAHFLGEMGESFYREYEVIKAKKRSK